MKRQRIRTKFFVVELQGGNGNAGQAELSNKEESADELAESDSESEQLLVSSPHRKSSKKSHHKRARNETPNSDDESEEWTFTSHSKAPLRPVASSRPSALRADCVPPVSILAFREVVDYAKTRCLSWQSYIDYSKETVLLYRLNVDSLIPTITRSVQIRLVHGETARRKITVNVCVENKLLDNDFVILALKKSEICSGEDIGLLLKHVEQVVSDTADRNQPARSTPSFSLNDPDKLKGSSASLLLSIGADLHRERCRNAMLFRKKNTEERFRVGQPVPAKKNLPSVDVTADSDRSPSFDSPAEDHHFPNDETSGSSVASSLAGWLSETSAESQGKAEQFLWFEPADNRAKLLPGELYVNAWFLAYLKRNYGLTTSQPRTMSKAIHYGWDLICHMLGGPAVICRRLKSMHSDQEKTAAALLGVNVFEMVTEHVQHSFFSKKERATETFSPEAFTEAINKKLFDLPSTQDRKKVVADKASAKLKQLASDNGDSDEADDQVKRLKEQRDGVMHPIYSKNTCKAAGRVPLSSKHPSIYINKDRLEEIQRVHGPGADDREGLKGLSWYGYKVLEHLIGGEEQLRQCRTKFEKRKGGMARMVGKKLLEVVLDHCNETYPTVPPMKQRYLTYWCAIYARHTRVRDDEVINRNALASVLFVGDVPDAPPPPTDPPCEPHVRYWSTPHPSRVRLDENHEYYVDRVGLAQYQRYYGPESALGETSFTEYTFLVLQHLVGGEELVLRQFREHESSALSWLRTTLDQGFLQAYCAHVVRLFPAAQLDEEKVFHALKRSITSKLVFIRKGKCRLPKGVVYIDGNIPEQVTLLDEHEYWRTPAEERTQLRKGHDVYINTAFLQSAQASYGPLSGNAASKKYAFAIMEHMLGGAEVIDKARNDHVFWQASRSMVRVDDVLALCLHTDETFHLSESLHPDKLFNYARGRIGDRRRDRSDRRQKYQQRYSLK